MDRKSRRLDSQLCAAVKTGEPRSVQLLLSQGAIPDAVGTNGVAAIHLAVGKETEKNLRCLKLLLQHGADPNVRSSDGLTPIHIAALWGCYQNLKLLLTNGGNPNIKDNEGNTPVVLAELEDNRKCAQLLQDYLPSSASTEEEDLPHFKYSLYSDNTDTSGYPESDYSFGSYSSMISDLGEAPLSSTRRSSFFKLSNLNGRPNCKGILHNRPSDVYTENKPNPHWNTSLHWSSEDASLLSSTRMSAVGATAPDPKDNDVFATDDVFPPEGNIPTAITDGPSSPTQRYALPAILSKRASRKSVSFCNVDEYFPVFSSESPKQTLAVNDTQAEGYLSFDLSENSDFLYSEHFATVLHKLGVDVTSPDHVYVFCRESSESTDEALEKTVISPCTLDDNNCEKVLEDIKAPQENIPEKPTHCSGAGSSSGSNYSSCESDHYTSALDVSVHPKLLSVSEKTAAEVPEAQSECPVDVCKIDTMGLDGHLHPSPVVLKACADPGVITLSKDDQPLKNSKCDSVEAEELTFISSPFVTGRTRSRQSRCSLRTSSNPEDLCTSSLFDETLPRPLRTQRLTPRSQNSNNSYNSPRVPCYTPNNLDRQGSVSGDYPNTQFSTFNACGSSSQADTLILTNRDSDTVDRSQTFCDTVILEEDDPSMDSYERNLAEVIQAIHQQKLGRCESRDFLTDDVTNSDDTTKKANGARDEGCQQKENVWITEDANSLPDSVSSSSSSSYFSPRRSRQDSDLPCTSGTGCTPRYSMSRLSTNRRSEHLANLSYTPGGRPHIDDVDKPVEYLYTDTEQGHKLIETHIPPTANTSLSSSMSTTSSEETILYDWCSMQSNNREGKENQEPQKQPQNKKTNEAVCRVFQETEGMTDKELRRKLIEFGKSPGPITSRTRPVYIRRLCCLLQDSHYKPSEHQNQVEQPQTAHFGYSPELNLALKTFKMPVCQDDEQALCQQFDQPNPNRKWREGFIKSSFNYLLLDPRVTKNLPFRSQTMTTQECFQAFVHAIFYVGKGKRSRPYSHLYEALEYYKGDKTSKKLCPKVQQILQVWNADQGVISLHCFQNVIPVEAYTREACMVEAIGLKMLTNQKRGDFYGVVSNWQLKRKRELGVHLLYRAMQIFLAEGERQLRPADIRQ
ncbi:ankyrin repeat and LEM domain-containing protein 1 isoform X1 [Entelurus aequoreus]|uniref:ankyrin repeat and LEM domain-containing protein 1 isoform X1 n=1 Tax=Entelurus aequoreus TaxID=161455 RepID=UPI002B1D7F90|nr:ankyrin repeat and LEM domain-containing protein 1 isoform X1 [Entelurus aequoreus]